MQAEPLPIVSFGNSIPVETAPVHPQTKSLLTGRPPQMANKSSSTKTPSEAVFKGSMLNSLEALPIYRCSELRKWMTR